MKEIKKYLIGFIIGVFSVGTFTYAADNGSIGSLFNIVTENSLNVWRLGGDNIEDGTIDSSEIENGTIEKGDLINALSLEITTNTAKVGITSSQSNAIIINTAKVGITAVQSNEISLNTAKVGITEVQSDAINANTIKTTFSGNYNDLTNKPSGIVDTNTQLTESQVDSFVSNNGYVNNSYVPRWENVSINNTSFFDKNCERRVGFGYWDWGTTPNARSSMISTDHAHMHIKMIDPYSRELVLYINRNSKSSLTIKSGSTPLPNLRVLAMQKRCN